MKKYLLILLLIIVALVGYLYLYPENIDKAIEMTDIQDKIPQLEQHIKEQEIDKVEQVWISSANGWGEVILTLHQDGRFVLSYDLLEDKNIHYFRGSWKSFPNSIVLDFIGEPPYMADSINYQMIDDNSYRFKFYKDNRKEKCLEISGLVLNKKIDQENTSDN